MDPFNVLSTTATARKIPPLKETSPTKVMSCALIASTDLQKDLDAAKEVTGGADAPSAKMPGRPWFVANWSTITRVNHHERTKLPPVPVVVERALLVLFPFV
jgi:hypothetical protein